MLLDLILAASSTMTYSHGTEDRLAGLISEVYSVGMPVNRIIDLSLDHEDTGKRSAKILLFCSIGKSLVLAHLLAKS